MPSLSVVDMEGKNVGTVELAESVFGIEPNSPGDRRAQAAPVRVRQELPSGLTAA